MATSEHSILSAQPAPTAATPANSGSASEALFELLVNLAEQLGADFGAILLADERLRIRHAGSGLRIARTPAVIRARFDTSTGLMTRREFEAVLDDVLSNGSRSTTRHCLLHVDIDELQ